MTWQSPEGHVDDGALIAFRDGRGARADHRDIESHLASCEACRALLVAYQRPVPDALIDFGKEALKRRSRPWGRAAAGLALAASIALAFSLVGRPSRAPDLPQYAISGPLGGVAARRGPQPTSIPFFVKTSQIRWVLQPAAPAPQAHLRVFVESVERSGQVREVKNGKTTVSDRGAMRHEVSTAQLFGDRFGPRTVHFLISTAAPTNAAFDGPLDDLIRDFPRGQWKTSVVDYRTDQPEEGTDHD